MASPIGRSVMRTHGYCAPEVKYTRSVSQASDVYNFGVVLLELVSGRLSQHTTDDGEVISLVNWIQSVVPNKWAAAEAFDIELLRYQNEKEPMMQLLQRAMDCVTVVLERRPKISQVVRMLEEISGMDTEDQPITESRLEDLQPPIGSRLEDVLGDLLPRLTP